MTRHDPLEQFLAQALKGYAAHSVPPTVDLWPTINERTKDHVHKAVESRRASLPVRLRRGVVVTALACTLVAASGAGIVTASPQARNLLHRAVVVAAGAVGISVEVSTTGQDMGGFNVSPTPSFRIAELSPIPSALTHHEFTYIPAHGSGHKTQQPAVSIGTGENLQAVMQSTRATISQLAAAGIDTVWLHFNSSAPQPSYVDIIEHAAQSGYSLPPGKVLSVEGVPATLQQVGDQVIVSFVRFGTAVTLRTNMGRDSALTEAGALTWK